MHKMYANLSRARPVAILTKVDNGQSLCNLKTGSGMIEFECFGDFSTLGRPLLIETVLHDKVG